MPRLFRESPLNSIWEGSGNVNALDVLRALRAARVARRVADRGRRGARRRRPARRAPSNDVLQALAESQDAEAGRAGWPRGWPSCLQASLLVRHSPADVADAFVASRLANDWGGVFGTLPADHTVRSDHRAHDRVTPLASRLAR